MEKTESDTLKRSIAQWHEVGSDESGVPICSTVCGVSMYPLIRMGKDIVIINHVKQAPAKGDIVLFHDPVRDRYVLHRLWDIAPGRMLTWGDNCLYPDGWMRSEFVWGIAVAMRRGNRIIRFDSNTARICGILFAKLRHQYIRARKKAFEIAIRLPAPIKTVLKKTRKILVRVKRKNA